MGILNYAVIAALILLFIANIIASFNTYNTECGKFVRSIKLFVYDITPALYVTFSLLILLLGKIFGDDNYTGMLIAVGLLLLSCLTAYGERFLSMKKVRKKAVKREVLPIVNTKKNELPKLVLVKKATEMKPLRQLEPLNPTK